MVFSHFFCGGSHVTDAKQQIVHEGALQYWSRKQTWKKRWFSLEANSYGLFKKTQSGHNRLVGCSSQQYVLIQSVQPLSAIRESTAKSISPISRVQDGGIEAIMRFGFSILTSKNAWITFHTETYEEECIWAMIMIQYSHGFTREITEMLTDRGLLDGKYTYIRELGRGASGLVSLYMCQGRPYAIKKLFAVKEKKCFTRPLKITDLIADEAKLASETASIIPETVRREIAVLKKATLLPYVIQLHDIILDVEHKQYYLVMEYMGGGSVAEWDTKEMKYKMAIPHDDKMIKIYFTQVIIALRALHSNGLCHRDIKPENLMVSQDLTTCKVVDLGVAQYFVKEDHGQQMTGAFDVRNEFANEDTTRATGKSETIPNKISTSKPIDLYSRLSVVLEQHEVFLTDTKGTYPFLPPEALSNARYGGFKADIWAAGVTLYALIFEKLPFFSISTLELFEQIQSSILEFPKGCEDTLLKDLLQRLLEKDAHERIDIDQILHHQWLAPVLESVHQHVEERQSSITVNDHEVHGIFSALQCHFGTKKCSKATETQKKTEQTASIDKSRSICSNGFPLPTIDIGSFVLPKWINLELIAAKAPFNWTRLAPVILNADCSGSESRTQDHEIIENRELLCVRHMMLCVTAAGCRISRKKVRDVECQQGQNHSVSLVFESTKSTLKQPNQTKIRLPWEFDLLMDRIMHNVYEIWAQDLRKQGWKSGAVFNLETKIHPSLKSFSELNDDEKTELRRGIALTFKTCLEIGYEFTFQRRTSIDKLIK
ncbi:unnamed protein product [Albugo candida]|uniref:Protein kinase domain-containing protein n=1 Tax=Albugo candida TaxID=65357 RepID=A0A024GNR6_9STRA|nr:unnamed protein product [Albugo candida]|eukprot:CCI48190.1 unnamed protein product [Albugo candida]